MDNVIYSYHPVTREFLGTTLADESPLEPGVLLLPANSSRQEPPQTAEREVAVFDLDSDNWQILPDFRGATLYTTTDGTPVTVADIGPRPDGTTDQPRPSPNHEWSGDGWVLNAQTAAARVWDLIKAERDRRRFEGGVFVAGHWFLSTQIAAGEYNSIINLGLPEATVLRANWRTMDGSEVAMTPALARQIIVAGFAQAAAIDDAATAHKAAMEASPDPAAYDFSGSWPAIYEA